MFPVIEAGTFLKHSKLKLFSQTGKKKSYFLKNHLMMGKVWYFVMMTCYRVALGPRAHHLIPSVR